MNNDDLIRVIKDLTSENLLLKSQISGSKENPDSEYYNSARLLTEIATLEDEKRKVRYLSPFAEAPSVAEQVDGVILIGNALGKIIKKHSNSVNNHYITNFLLWHDAPESRYGDLGRDHRKYISINEDKARFDMFGGVSWGEEVIDLIERFEAGGEDINVKAAKDADALYVIYTIKDLLQKKYFINDPKTRIQKTLKRLATEEGLALGQEMAKRTPQQIWQLVGGGPPRKFLGLTMSVTWAIIELNKSEDNSNYIDRDSHLEAILANESSELINDSNLIVKIMEERRKSYNKHGKRLTKNSFVAKIKNESAKKLGDILSKIDLYEWWNLLMGYSTLNQDGTTTPNPR